jgi:hypothetical protein
MDVNKFYIAKIKKLKKNYVNKNISRRKYGKCTNIHGTDL